MGIISKKNLINPLLIYNMVWVGTKAFGIGVKLLRFLGQSLLKIIQKIFQPANVNNAFFSFCHYDYCPRR